MIRFCRHGICILVVAIILASPASADVDSYLQYLRNHYVRLLNLDDGRKIAAGMTACEQLREGRSPDHVDTIGVTRDWRDRWDRVDMHAIVDGAQHELCPDTLAQYNMAP